MERRRSPDTREGRRYRERSSPVRRRRPHDDDRYDDERRGRVRSRSYDSHGVDDPYRRRNDDDRRRRSRSSDYGRKRLRSRNDDYADGDYNRHDSIDRNRREDRAPESCRRRKKRRRRDERSARRRRYRSSSSPQVSPRVPAPAPGSRRAGVVSDDEAETAMGAGIPVISSKKEDSSTSSRDDTVGHFRGGPGTIIADRFKVVRDVGLGTFGRVVECLDLRRSRRSGRGEGDYVAIKIVRDVRRYYDSALIEANIVEEVNRRGGRGVSHCAIMYDAFTWNSHFCMVFEDLGPSLYDFLKRHNYQPFPMICVRDFARQLLETLEFMHSFGLIHTDLKPENILLMNYREVPYKWHGRTYIIPESTKVKIIDFGGATYDNEKKSSVVNTRQYRAPEVILGLGWSMPSDLWSAGCILAELYQGELLFATHDNQEHLALIERIVAPFPSRMLRRAKNSQLVSDVFNSNGRHRLEAVLPPESAAYVSKVRPLDSSIRQEDGRFLNLLRMLLVISPDERATAQACVRHRL